MSKSTIPDKRQTARYLCDEFFTGCTLTSKSEQFVATAIDFTKEGMGLFSNDNIPESESLSIELSYQSPSLRYDFGSIPCVLVHFNLTEVGNHCGIRFLSEYLTPEQLAMLSKIEQTLSKKDDPEDRYHLFGEE